MKGNVDKKVIGRDESLRQDKKKLQRGGRKFEKKQERRKRVKAIDREKPSSSRQVFA